MNRSPSRAEPGPSRTRPVTLLLVLGIACAVLLASSPAPSLAEPLFAAPFIPYNAGGESVAAGDLNNDGIPDLVSTLGGALSVLLGNAAGTFDLHRLQVSGGTSVAIGDLNGDGKADLVTARADRTVSVMLGNGDGTFGASSNYASVGGYGDPVSVAIGDLSGDGKLDLAVSGDGVAVLLGNGDGTFGPKTDYAVRGASVGIGDLNRDGKPDLAIAGPGELSVLLGTGGGALGAPTRYPTGYGVSTGPQALAIGDLNGDGKPDLTTANQYGISSTVSVLLGNGDGTFGPRTDYAAGGASVVIGDLNGDRKPDLAVANSDGTNTVSVLLGNGDGTFMPRSDYASGPGTGSVTSADLNRDGKLDLAGVSRSGGLSVLFGNGDGTLGTKSQYPVGYGYVPSVAIGDLNGDGRSDLAASDYFRESVAVLLGNGDGTFGSAVEYPGGGTGVAIGDLNGDRKPDLATVATSSNSVSVLLGNGDGTFGPRSDYATGGYCSAVVIGDLNADGKPDLVTSNYFSTVSVLLGNGDGTFGPKSDFATVGGPASLVMGDLNADGHPDLVAGSGSGHTEVSVLLGNGDGTFGPKSDYIVGTDPVVAIGDLNGDGKPDLVAGLSNDVKVSVLLGTGDGTFGPKSDYTTGIGPRSVVVGDLNGDGKPDLATGSYFLNTISVLLGNGDGTFGSRSDYGAGASPVFSMAIGYLNADRKPDLAVGTVGSISVLLNIGPTPNADPDCRRARAVPSVLTRHDHGLQRIRIKGVTDPNGDPLTIRVVGVTQDEPLISRDSDGRTDRDEAAVAGEALEASAADGDALDPGADPAPGLSGTEELVDLGPPLELEDRDEHGGKRQCPDAVLDTQGRVAVRAERDAHGNGRVYVISYVATDGKGGSCTGNVKVCVPRNGHRAACRDDGQIYNSLGPCGRIRRDGVQAEAVSVSEVSLRVLPGAGRQVALEYGLPEEAEVSLAVYDVAGRRLATLQQGRQSAGMHETNWDANGLGGGVYFYRLQVGEKVVSKAGLLLR